MAARIPVVGRRLAALALRGLHREVASGWGRTGESEPIAPTWGMPA